MDATLAVLAVMASFGDMSLNYCDNGCFAPNPVESRLSVSAGSVVFLEEAISEEVFLRYDFGVSYGPFQPAVGASMTSDGDVWAGAGFLWTGSFFDDSGYVQLSVMPGLWERGDGPDLGHAIEFRSGIEIGYEARNGWRYGLSLDHRSNAGIGDLNPGVETLQLRLSIPM